MGDTLQDAIAGKTSYDSVILLDQNVNRNANFCLRLLSKGQVNQNHIPTLYSSILILELVGDVYKDLANACQKVTITPTLKQALTEYQKFFHMLYELWFSFDMQKSVSVALKFQSLDKKLTTMKARAVNKPAHHLFHSCVRNG